MTSSLMATDTDIPLGRLEVDFLPGKPDSPVKENLDVKLGETVIEGQNPAFEKTEEQEEIPPLTYVDFMPKCLGTGYLKGKRPEFSEFGTVMEQVNQWLETMPQYRVSCCETIVKKLNSTTYELDKDVVLEHISSHGNNVFLMGLRLWLVPKMELQAPVQKLSYVTILPDSRDPQGVLDTAVTLITQQTGLRITAMQLFQQYTPLSKTMEKCSRQLQLNPIKGQILNAETVKILLTEDFPKPQPERTCWVECGKTNRLFVYGIRIFYVVGEPVFESLGIHDVSPDYIRCGEVINQKFKFATYQSTVKKAYDWIRQQQGIKVINLQTADVKIDRLPSGGVTFDSDRCGHGEMSHEDSLQFVKVLRIFYIKTPKDNSPENPLTLTSRLFVPVRKNQTGKNFESLYQTMQRVIAWLSLTGCPLLSMESVQYQVSPDSWGTGVAEDRVDTVKSQISGRYNLTCIRLYFCKEFEEPSPDLLPPTKEDEEGWMCVIS